MSPERDVGGSVKEGGKEVGLEEGVEEVGLEESGEEERREGKRSGILQSYIVADDFFDEG